MHPEYRVLRENQEPAVTDTLTPVYPMTEGIQQGRLRNLVGQALAMMKESPPAELLPTEILDELELPILTEALAYLHTPPPDTDLASIEAGVRERTAETVDPIIIAVLAAQQVVVVGWGMNRMRWKTG